MKVFKATKLLVKGDRTFFDFPLGIQKEFLNSFREPCNDIERSYYQYLCHNFYIDKGKAFILNVISAISFPFILVFLLFYRLSVHQREQIDTIGDFKDKDAKGIIPDVLSSQYVINSTVWGYHPSLSFIDIRIVFKLAMRYLQSPSLILKCMLKIGLYSSLIKQYHPKRIIVHNEYSYTSSILTWYCGKNSIEHINVMHGEKLFDLKDTFFHFHKCYVWDAFYISLFCQLRAEPTQFIISIPPALKIDTYQYFNKDVFATYKYYLAEFSEKEIYGIVKSMEFAKEKGESVKYRPHPRYSDINLLKKYVPEECIEYPDKVPFYESLASLSYAVGSFTTVLIQAYFSGMGVICDDMTFKEQYDKLADLNYFLANCPLPKLSEYQNYKSIINAEH